MQKQFQLKHTLPIFLVYNPHFDVTVEFTFFAKKKNNISCRHYLDISEKEMSI